MRCARRGYAPAKATAICAATGAALVIDERTDAWCREKYERWLEERGVAEFGLPIERGSAQARCSDAQAAEADEAGDGPESPSLRAA